MFKKRFVSFHAFKNILIQKFIINVRQEYNPSALTVFYNALTQKKSYYQKQKKLEVKSSYLTLTTPIKSRDTYLRTTALITKVITLNINCKNRSKTSDFILYILYTLYRKSCIKVCSLQITQTLFCSSVICRWQNLSMMDSVDYKGTTRAYLILDSRQNQC